MGIEYIKSIEGSTWFDAQSQSGELGGYLVSINNESENNFLSTAIREKILNEYGRYGEYTKLGYWINHPYIGFSDFAIENDWIWESGEEVTFTNWAATTANKSQLRILRRR